MVLMYRSMAWLLIFTMLFHSVSEVNLVFAEETPTASCSVDGEQKRRRRRVRSQSNNGEKKESSPLANDVSAQNLTKTSKDILKVDETGRKFLTTLGNEDIFGNEVGRAKSKKAYSDLAKQNVFSMLESHAINLSSVLADTMNLSESAALAFSSTEADSLTMGDASVELRLNGFLVGAESSVLNAQPINGFSLNS